MKIKENKESGLNINMPYKLLKNYIIITKSKDEKKRISLLV